VDLVAAEYLICDFRLEKLRVLFGVQEPGNKQKPNVQVPGLEEGRQEVPRVDRQVVTLIGVDGGLEGGEELRRQVVLGLVKLGHQLVDLVEVQKVLRLVIEHAEPLPLQDEHLVIQLALVEPPQ
jgi:hypothetical protein